MQFEKIQVFDTFVTCDIVEKLKVCGFIFNVFCQDSQTLEHQHSISTLQLQAMAWTEKLRSYTEYQVFGLVCKDVSIRKLKKRNHMCASDLVLGSIPMLRLFCVFQAEMCLL